MLNWRAVQRELRVQKVVTSVGEKRRKIDDLQK